jgi:hypothetical protein
VSISGPSWVSLVLGSIPVVSRVSG